MDISGSGATVVKKEFSYRGKRGVKHEGREGHEEKTKTFARLALFVVVCFGRYGGITTVF
jgi:hypothetical protein